MQLSTLFTSFTLAVHPTTEAAVSGEYYLQARVIPHPMPGAPHSHFDGTYVQPYHTGAGLDDVVFTANRSATYPGFLNGTYQQFVLPEAPGESFPWGLYVNTEVEYTDFQAVQLNTGYGNDYGAFFFNGTGLQFNTAGTAEDPMANVTNLNEWAGWLACDWWHGNLAQLFWIMSYSLPTFPANCAKINLFAVDV